MEKRIILVFLTLLSFTIKAQNPLFEKTVDTINVIIKANPLFYYMPERQYSGFVKKISVTEAGLVSFTDSIPEKVKSTNSKKVELQSDCCPQKNSRTLDLHSIKNWDIHFPTAYLKNEKDETIGKIIGLKKPDLESLKTQFELLQSLSIAYAENREKAKKEAIEKMNKDRYRCEPANLQKKAAAEAAKKAHEISQNKN